MKNDSERERNRSLSICTYMTEQPQTKKLSEILNRLLDEQSGYFLVDVHINPGNNIDVTIDADQGVAIDACTKLSRALSKEIEEQEIFPPDDYALEVGSSGVGTPLLLHRQYIKNIGRYVEVKLKDGTMLEGELKEAGEDGIVVETKTGKGKKQEIKPSEISFENIKTTTVQIKF